MRMDQVIQAKDLVEKINTLGDLISEMENQGEFPKFYTKEDMIKLCKRVKKEYERELEEL